MTALSTNQLNQYSPETKLAHIPWDHLPPAIQATCRSFIDSWWRHLDLDQPLEASGLLDMTLADIQHLHQHERENQASRQYRVITFMRIEPEDHEPLTYEQALSEKEQQDLMFPEHLHHIEEIST